jgi:CRISPR-associated protein Csy1
LDYLEYLDLLASADILLDPPHFGGVNSTYDGLALGQPIVTWPSSYHRGRYTAGCYRKMGVDDCIVTSAEEYVERAIQLANEVGYRAKVSRRIEESRSVLFHDVQAVQAHQEMFEQLIEVSRSR